MRMRNSMTRSLVLLAVLAPALAAAADSPAVIGKGTRFNSAGVLDLADLSLRVPDGRAIEVGELAAAAAERIFAAAAVDENELVLRFSDDEFGCKTPSRKCTAGHERQRLDASGGAVRRDGKRVIAAAASGSTVEVVDLG